MLIAHTGIQRLVLRVSIQRFPAKKLYNVLASANFWPAQTSNAQSSRVQNGQPNKRFSTGSLKQKPSVPTPLRLITN